MFRMLRFLIGVTLVPMCVAVTLALLQVLRHTQGSGVLLSPETTWLLTGYFIWLGMWFFLPQPVRAYVVAHELTHALWAVLFGGRVRKMKISTAGGSVHLTKTNLLITLAPYFFPLYTVLLLLVRFLLGLAMAEVPYPLVWLFFVGFTWSFHVTFTIQSLLTTQPDINEYGRLFSYTVIYLLNILGVGLWVVLSTSATLPHFTEALIVHAVDVYASLADEVHTRYHFVVDALQTLLRMIRHQ